MPYINYPRRLVNSLKTPADMQVSDIRSASRTKQHGLKQAGSYLTVNLRSLIGQGSRAYVSTGTASR